MKNKIIFTVLIASLGMCALTGCSKGGPTIPGSTVIDLSQYKKDLAITEKNDDNYTYTKEALTENFEFFYDYYYDNTDNLTYKSIYTDKGFSCSRGRINKYVTEGGNTYYKANNKYYDAFGDEIVDFTPTASEIFNKYYICAENSPIYKKLSGFTDEQVKDSNELRILKIEIFNNGWRDIGALVKEVGDTRIHARNYFTGSDLRQLMDDDNNMLDDYSMIHKMNESEYIVDDGSSKKRVRYNNNEAENANDVFETNVKYETETDTVESEYDTIFSIKFPGTTDVFSYQMKKVDEISNDFDFVLDGERFDSRIVLGNTNIENPKFHFVGYGKSSKDKTFGFLLAKKIKDDGVLSNTNYSVKIDNTLKMSNLIQDISIFTEDNYILNDELKTIGKDEELLVLNKDFAILKNKYRGQIINKNGYYEGFGDSTIEFASYNSVNNEYLYYTTTKNGVKNRHILQAFNGNTRDLSSDAKIISESKLMYKYNDKIYIGTNEIADCESSYSYRDHSYKSFGEEVNLVSLSITNIHKKDEAIKVNFTK